MTQRQDNPYKDLQLCLFISALAAISLGPIKQLCKEYTQKWQCEADMIKANGYDVTAKPSSVSTCDSLVQFSQYSMH